MHSRKQKEKAKEKTRQVASLEFAHLTAAATADSTSPASTSATSQEESKKKKRKRRRSDDSAYSKRSQKNKKKKNATKPESILQLRADNSLTVTEDGVEVEKKTAVILRATPLRVKESTKQLIQERFAEHQSKVKTNRPIEEVTQRSATGTPLQVRTPGKSLLALSSKNGVLYGFSNAATLFTSPQRTVDSSFSTTSPAANVKPNPHPIKHVKTFVTPESLKLAAKEIRENAGQRSVSQNAVMAASGVAAKKASANQYAKAAKLTSGELRWEWLHLIAHHVLASKAQNEHNLALGTYHANTEMLGAELTLRPLAELFPQGFWLEVKAHCIPGKQVLTQIEYTITTDDFVLPFVFNAQQKHKPDVYNLAYIDALIHTFKDIKAATKEIESDEDEIDLPKIVRKKVDFADSEDDEAEVNDENTNTLNRPIKKVDALGLFNKMSPVEKVTEEDFKALSPFKAKK